MKIKELEATISPERLENCFLRFQHRVFPGCGYWHLHKKDLYEAYIFNERISKELRFTLAQFEVILRNQVDKVLAIDYGEDWLTNGYFVFGRKEQNSVNDAAIRIEENGKTVTHQRLLAKLSFGFWARLFNHPYNLADKYKDSIFLRNNSRSTRPPFLKAKEIRENLVLLNRIRNKVSHQEFILDPKYDINTLHKECLKMMNLIHKDYYPIFQIYENFDRELHDFNTFKNGILALPELVSFK